MGRVNAGGRAGEGRGVDIVGYTQGYTQGQGEEGETCTLDAIPLALASTLSAVRSPISSLRALHRDAMPTKKEHTGRAIKAR